MNKLKRDTAYNASFGEYSGIFYPCIDDLLTIPKTHQKAATQKLIEQGSSGVYYILAEVQVFGISNKIPSAITKKLTDDRNKIFGTFIPYEKIDEDKFDKFGKYEFDINDWSVDLNCCNVSI